MEDIMEFGMTHKQLLEAKKKLDESNKWVPVTIKGKEYYLFIVKE